MSAPITTKKTSHITHFPHFKVSTMMTSISSNQRDSEETPNNMDYCGSAAESINNAVNLALHCYVHAQTPNRFISKTKCYKCDGKGQTISNCIHCNGTKYIHDHNDNENVKCDQCNGYGYTCKVGSTQDNQEICSDCYGNGTFKCPPLAQECNGCQGIGLLYQTCKDCNGDGFCFNLCLDSMNQCQSKCHECNQYFNKSEMRPVVQYSDDSKKKFWTNKCENCWQKYQFRNGLILCDNCISYFPKNKIKQIWNYAKQGWMYKCDRCSTDLMKSYGKLQHRYLIISDSNNSNQHC